MSEGTSNETSRLVLAKADEMTIDSYLNMYRKLVGREPTPQEIEELKATMAADDQPT